MIRSVEVVYDICEACDVDHSRDSSVCKWPLTAITLFYLRLHPDHPFVPCGLARIELKILEMVYENR